MTKRIAVVCEGRNDFVAMERLCPALTDQVLEFKCVQPNPDASSSHGGFGRVIGWCKKNGGSALGALFDRPLFSGGGTYDALLVHIDGDACRDCANHAGVVPPREGASASEIVAAMTASLKLLLTPSDIHASKIIAAVPVLHTESWLLAGPVLHTESWLLAGLSNENLNWEQVNAKHIFERKFLRSGRGFSSYDSRSIEAAAKVAVIKERCSSFEIFEMAFNPVISSSA